MASPGKIRKRLIRLTLFAIAMGFLESAVVVYLREIFYPGGFSFPLAQMDPRFLLTEILREAATMVMLITLGLIAGNTRSEKFAFFLYSFGVWDIFYYLFLKCLLNWPGSWFDWDILFLIPTIWTGPVLAPVILSVIMIGIALYVIIGNGLGRNIRFRSVPLTVLIGGAFLIFLSFIYDYSTFILNRFSLSDLFRSGEQEMIRLHSSRYIPLHFPWWLFVAGLLVIFAGFYLLHHSNKK